MAEQLNNEQKLVFPIRVRMGEFELCILDDLRYKNIVLACDRGQQTFLLDWKSNQMMEYTDMEIPENAKLRVTAEVLQGMMNSLWDAGYRPKQTRYEREEILMREQIEYLKKIVNSLVLKREAKDGIRRD